MNYRKLNWIIIGAIIIINIFFYPFVPSKMAIKFSFGGTPTRFLIKELALLIIPAIAALTTFMHSDDESRRVRTLIINIFLFALNLGVNIFNLLLM